MWDPNVHASCVPGFFGSHFTDTRTECADAFRSVWTAENIDELQSAALLRTDQFLTSDQHVSPSGTGARRLLNVNLRQGARLSKHSSAHGSDDAVPTLELDTRSFQPLPALHLDVSSMLVHPLSRSVVVLS